MNSDMIRALVSALPMPVLLIGSDQRVHIVNRAANAIVGVQAEGRHYMTALRAPAFIDCVETAFRDRVAATGRHLSYEMAHETLWAVRAEPLSGDGFSGVMVSFQDITALAAAGQMRRDFVANVSHELRTPLTALIGFIETLQGAARDDPTARGRFLAIMAHEAARMERLVSDLLSLNRVESEARVRPSAEVDLAPLLTSVRAALLPQATERGVAIEITTGDGDSLVRGDSDQLTQVVTNLVENAIKYAAAGRLVTIALTEAAMDPVLKRPAARIEVIDRGEGFEPVHIPRLTERFYRIDTHRSREEGGTGLGLAIVKHIVGRHRGRLSIDSTPGQGSRFTVILPLAETGA